MPFIFMASSSEKKSCACKLCALQSGNTWAIAYSEAKEGLKILSACGMLECTAKPGSITSMAQGNKRVAPTKTLQHQLWYRYLCRSQKGNFAVNCSMKKATTSMSLRKNIYATDIPHETVLREGKSNIRRQMIEIIR